MRKLLQPEGWVRPKGYSNGVAASGRMVFTAGVVGWNNDEVFERSDFLGQFDQTLANTVAILAEGGAKPEDIVRMTAYLTDKAEYLSNLPTVGKIWLDRLGHVFPAVAFVEVKSLMEDAALIEIETTAMVPENA
ncbi:RidA family protein [Hyphomonas sp. KY3]|jgi:enamine deaminase RidA (YjgF/YER057c/UK114 family)|uniref:RidA family protein n=1 Tax=Hyphomonas sp. KY3 TaxID=2016196 RepID=UPI001A8C9AC8|nr:RidA family protein [Hyphomonas sp. KY3]QSR22069.1 enamine deaminase RidA [Hyphomonas sp. KY3]|tara:strand:+ start:1069 stop:1470 length:402 start_codon:yes stop_codon:yes gene_type:complete